MIKPHLRPAAWLALAFVAGLALAGCAGCSTTGGFNKIELPDISAQEIRYKRTDPAGGTQIQAVNVVDHGDRVTADKLSLTTIYPSFSISIEVDGYERLKTTKRAEAALAVPAAAPAK